MSAPSVQEPPPLTPEQRALVSSPAALAMASRLARRFGRRYGTLVGADDLLGIAQLALAHAARSYNPAFGVAFEVYAWSRVHGMMMNEVRSESRHGRALREGAYRQVELQRDEGDLWNDGEEQRSAQLAAFSDGLVASALVGLVGEASKDLARGHESPLAEDEAYRHAIDALVHAVTSLPPPDPQLVWLVYSERRTLHEAAAALGISYSSARRYHARALERLSKRLHAAGVREAPPPKG